MANLRVDHQWLLLVNLWDVVQQLQMATKRYTQSSQLKLCNSSIEVKTSNLGLVPHQFTTPPIVTFYLLFQLRYAKSTC
jgi:hypothetical protein